MFICEAGLKSDIPNGLFLKNQKKLLMRNFSQQQQIIQQSYPFLFWKSRRLQDYKEFENCWHAIWQEFNISFTNKAHILKSHVPQVIEITGRGLHYQSDEVMEAKKLFSSIVCRDCKSTIFFVLGYFVMNQNTFCFEVMYAVKLQYYCFLPDEV